MPSGAKRWHASNVIVAVSHVSNATGTIYPIEQITRMAHERGIPVLIDGAQAVPHMPVDVRALGCDFYTGSGHKMRSWP